MIVFERTFVEPESLRDGADRILLPDHTTCEEFLHMGETVRGVAVNHILGNPRLLRNDVDDVLSLDRMVSEITDLDLDRGGIEPADGLVGEVQVADVFRRHLKCRIDCFVRNRN